MESDPLRPWDGPSLVFYGSMGDGGLIRGLFEWIGSPFHRLRFAKRKGKRENGTTQVLPGFAG
jgi:hypothetical protein